MAHTRSIERRSISLPNNDSLLPKRVATSFPLLLPTKWFIHQTTTKSQGQRHGPTANNPCYHHPWATTLIRECAIAINEKNPSRINHLLWLLNDLVSPYGDIDQRLGYYFLQTLFAKANNNNASLWYENQKFICFNDKLNLVLSFQEVSPWTTFGHVASNSVILEALLGQNNDLSNNTLCTHVHVIDLSNTLCTQWPTLIEALATRFDEAPSLKLTLVVKSCLEEIIANEVSQRMGKFARLMGVPFKIRVLSGLDCLEEVKIEDLGLEEGEAIVVNCIQALQRVKVEKRGVVINMIKSINPKIVTIVEEEVNLTTTRNDFAKSFDECLRFYKLYFEMLEESFGLISSDRIRLEKERFRNLISVLACDHDNDDIGERISASSSYGWMPNRASEWSKMILVHGFMPYEYNDEVGDIRALLRRYNRVFYWDVIELQKKKKENYDQNQVGIQLTWKDEPIVWFSSWKPNNVS